jgi:hypothetical protein
MDAPVLRRLADVSAEAEAAFLLTAAVVAACALYPAALIGTVATAVLWKAMATPLSLRLLMAGLGLAGVLAIAGSEGLQTLWGDRFQFRAEYAVTGPFLACGLWLAEILHRRILFVSLAREERYELHQRRSLERGAKMHAGEPPLDTTSIDPAISLGVDVRTRRPFSLSSKDLEHHVFVPGLQGTGKTTTLKRLCIATASLGWSVVIIDPKETQDFRDIAFGLARSQGMPYHEVNPNREDTLGYDPCQGSPGEVTNKLLAPFRYEGSAEVYKRIMQGALPRVIRALEASGQEISLDSIMASFAGGQLGRLGREAGSPHKELLAALESDRKSGLAEQAFTGFYYRLAALAEGTFGTLFRKRPALDWKAINQPSVTYFGLNAQSAPEDVPLMAAVVSNDLKDVSAKRLALINSGVNLPPALIVFDEFAALGEQQEAVAALIRMARQSLLVVVIATQTIPQEASIANACLGVGLILSHRVVGGKADDAEVLAGQLGTKQAMKLTGRISFEEPGGIKEGSLREVRDFIVHPDQLKTLSVGQVAVRSAFHKERPIVAVYRDPPFPGQG